MPKNAYVVKEVDPKGNILNDNFADNDYLGTSVYAEALARRILNVSTPLTIGIFARWGSGKSFLLNHVESFLKKFEQQSITGEKVVSNRPQKVKKDKTSALRKCFLPTLVLLILISITICSFIVVISPESIFPAPTQPKEQSPTSSVDSAAPTPQTGADLAKTPPTTTPTDDSGRSRRIRIVGIIVVAVILLSALAMVSWCSNIGTMFASTTHSMVDSIRLLMFAAFTVLPIDEAKGDVSSHVPDQDIRSNQTLKVGNNEVITTSAKRRFIFVNFKAWEYVGSDTLWAGIITNLSDKIEAQFGAILCRLFRTITLKTCPRDPEEQKQNAGKRRWTKLFVDLGTNGGRVDEEEMIEHMQEFGVVNGCHRYKDWMKKDAAPSSGNARKPFIGDGLFVVEFTQPSFAARAYQNLSLRGVNVSFKDPHAPPRKKKRRGATGSQRGDIPMSDMSNGREVLIRQSTRKPPPQQGHKQGPQKMKDKEQRGFFVHHGKFAKTTCFIPVLYWWILLVVTAVLVPVVTYVVAWLFDLQIFKYPRAVPLGIQIFAWLPGTASASFVLIRFVYAMFNSQRSRVQAAMEGSRGSMKEKLGFMDKVKTEVRTITQLIRLIEYVNQREYKVVINIDDLDRVPLDKIKSILDAVSILLSDSNSPFICLVAVDSRIAVKCIEGEIGQTLLKANVNGHEYMRKIINLPFCIPEIDDEHKKSFIDGLMDQSDRTNRIRLTKRSHSVGFTGKQHPHLADIGRSNSVAGTPTASLMNKSLTEADVTDAVVENLSDSPKAIPPPNFKDKNFLFECSFEISRFFYQSSTVHKHLHGVPRNIKRIFNIISITTLMINCYYKQKKKQEFFRTISEVKETITNIENVDAGTFLMEGAELNEITEEDAEIEEVESDIRNVKFAENLVCWIILTDQWPYRISFILQIIEDADQRYLAGKKDQEIPETMSLLKIYRTYVVPLLHKFKAGQEEASLMSLDGDPDIFYSFLTDLDKDGNRLTKMDAKLLMKFTVNLDQSLRQNIAYLRSVSDVDSQVDLEPTAAVVTVTSDNDVTDAPAKMKHSNSQDVIHMYPYGPGFVSSGAHLATFGPNVPYPCPQGSFGQQNSFVSTDGGPTAPVTSPPADNPPPPPTEARESPTGSS